METVLNLIWLIVALAGVWVWRFRWAATRQNSKKWVPTECVAMVCALALLFPVISLSDDLHPEVLAVDSLSGKRSGAHLLARSSRPFDATHALKHHPGGAILPAGTAYLSLIRFGSVPTPFLSDLITRSWFSRGRSPPALL